MYLEEVSSTPAQLRPWDNYLNSARCTYITFGCMTLCEDMHDAHIIYRGQAAPALNRTA